MIEYLGDGVYCRHKIMMHYRDADGHDITFLSDPDTLYVLIHTAVVKMSNLGIGPGMGVENVKHKRLAALIKVGIKGILMMYGEQILDALFNSTDHPRPEKGVDLLDWYNDMFTRIGITYAMKNDIILEGQFVGKDTIEVVGVTARPVTPAVEATGTSK